MLINEKVAYLKGIIDTANISADKPENRLLLEIVNALELIAFELDDQGQELSELNDYVEEYKNEIKEEIEILKDKAEKSDKYKIKLEQLSSEIKNLQEQLAVEKENRKKEIDYTRRKNS